MEKARNNVDDKPNDAKRQVERFIQTHSSLQKMKSSLSTSQVLGQTAHVTGAIHIIRYICLFDKSLGIFFVERAQLCDGFKAK